MEVMEEGNLMDRVPILLQRDLHYYQKHQSVLQEPICPGVVGGKLDFPRYASFSAIKIVKWWEDEYFAAYRKHSGLLHNENEMTDIEKASLNVKNSDPDKFVSLVTKSADLLLEHLHILSQESLDHADLSVLTATIGASALIRNCLQIYLQAATIKICPPKGDEEGGALKLSFKQYSEMSEALAERLLDLHCRLLLLYIIQDADCLFWEDKQAFFEQERGSYTIQMWWHYLHGTKDDLWNSVPPKMAQRIFGGILNETLSVLTVRYSQIITSAARAQLHLVDICNLLYCIAEILPYVCQSGEAYIGLRLHIQDIIVRDIHAKCCELFYCLILRGAPLSVLSKICRRGSGNMEMFSSRQGLPSAWIVFVLPKLLSNENPSQWATDFGDLNKNAAISLELKVLLACPQANWFYMVLLMRNAMLSGIILRHLMKFLPSAENWKNAAHYDFTENSGGTQKCPDFLCRSECFNVSDLIINDADPVGQCNYQIVLSLTYVVVSMGKILDIKTCVVSALEKCHSSGWSQYLDKRQVWNQKRPPWLEAIMHFVYPTLDSIVEILLSAVETGASMYQTMSLALTCFAEMWDCLPEGLYKVTALLQDVISVTTKPLGDSVLMQVIFAALYTELIRNAEHYERNEDSTRASICYSISEAICAIDEDDKHTDQMEKFLRQVRESMTFDDSQMDGTPRALSAVSTVKVDAADNEAFNRYNHHSFSASFPLQLEVETAEHVSEVLASDILTTKIGKQVLKVIYNYLKRNKDWLLSQLGTSEDDCSPFEGACGQVIKDTRSSVLKSMFFIGHTPFDQLLTGSLKIDYASWLQTPISLDIERAWLHLSRRSDFQDEAKLSLPDVALVAGITKTMKKRKDSNK